MFLPCIDFYRYVRVKAGLVVMHVLFLADNFPPETNAPASRTYEHCKRWVESGVEVTVITCVPNFPTGRVFGGYENKLIQEENMNGIRVIRVWTFLAPNSGFLGRTIDYSSFMISAFFASFKVRNIDCIVGTSPQFFTACAAYLVSIFRRKPWVFELRDLWPETITTVGAMDNGRIISLLERLELFLYRKSSLIVSVTESFKADLVKRRIAEKKIVVVRNGVDLTSFGKIQKDQKLISELSLSDQFIVGYIGTHGLCQSLEVLVNAAARIQSEHPDLAITFLFLGDGARKQHLRDLVSRKNLTNVLFLNSVSRAEVCRYWSIVDVAVVHLSDDPAFLKVIPSKIFEAMAMGVPLLHGVPGESQKLLNDVRCARFFEPENDKQLASEIKHLLNSPDELDVMSQRGIMAASEYSRERLADDMLVHLRHLTEKRELV
ncbi:MAG: glycosyltransferase family 4 protein [Gammaproteobacteria bacterium]|jgi:glycosyltransferase involved in cell wall biosynthesis